MRAAVYLLTVTEMRRRDNDVATQNCLRSGRFGFRLLAVVGLSPRYPAKPIPSMLRSRTGKDGRIFDGCADGVKIATCSEVRIDPKPHLSALFRLGWLLN